MKTPRECAARLRFLSMDMPLELAKKVIEVAAELEACDAQDNALNAQRFRKLLRLAQWTQGDFYGYQAEGGSALRAPYGASATSPRKRTALFVYSLLLRCVSTDTPDLAEELDRMEDQS